MQENLLMNRRERLRRCYYHEETDRPGVYSRTLFPANDPTYDRLKAYLARHSELKIDWDSTELETKYPMDIVTEPYSAELEREKITLHTPKGDLARSSLVRIGHQAKNQPKLHESYFIKDLQDIEKFLSLPMPEVGDDVSGFFAARKKVADAGIINVFLGANPAGFTAALFGTENFALMSSIERDLIHQLCERRMNIIINRLKVLLDKGVGPFFGIEGEELVAPLLHGPKDFDDFNAKYDKPIIELIHNAGGRIDIHCHGSIKKVLPSFIAIGTDVLHPFEAPPMGDITAKEAKEMSRGRLCLEGNIQINRMYEASPDEIRAETEQLINDVFDDNMGLIVCPTASPYIYGQGEVCFEQYKAMVDTVLEWKG
jgi:uroporphyrinogen-III decarboxylase